MPGLRIISGRFKGRRLRVPRGSAVRPTAERVREALFSILGESIVGQHVLDAYSGSGALGFEALSRGARDVVFIETDAHAVRTLHDNAAMLGASEQCRVLRGNASRLLQGEAVRQGWRFDLVLADPPYAAGEAREFLARVAWAVLLSAEGQVVLERETGRDAGSTGEGPLRCVRTVSYGRASLDFYRLG